MTQTYARRRKNGPETSKTNPGPAIPELAAGAAPTQAQMGSRVDLPERIREKMETSFGADFSGVKLYESETVVDAGAQAVTRGNNIAFAPGKLDLTSTAGQALLGHELSHVVSQARGESAGQGFLNDSHLEAQADAQGMMAARGESVYSGPVSPIGASAAAGAAGPMQAKKDKDKTPRTKDGSDVSAFAGDAPLDISEPQGIEYTSTQQRYFEPWYNELYSSPEAPDEATLDTNWHEDRLNWDYNREEALEQEAKDTQITSKKWSELCEGERTYSQWFHTAKDYHRADNGLTYGNFKLGIANARKRRGLDRNQG